ncbi:F-box/FBD/LRR-repeat protein At1g80470-like [Lotus japonicus]|uniref:F-box/FBD/LRR-repeat protein At1g80470-like n=1 Tax=Lotus japonicus TaxID=34305 RepID=UPI0025833F87|nr:F-box/FBD/LRR-repeat protein At1g80470-like [Lotus japonicus]
MAMEDGMNEVPDEIVEHILSYVETKDAMQCSVLSKRWRSLWRALPVLNFDSASFTHYSSFANFVLHVLHSSTSLTLTHCKFWFDISNPIFCCLQICIDRQDLCEGLVRMFIHHVTTHGVQHLTLLFPRIVDDLPLLFSCQSLQHLQLFELIILPDCWGFASLTTLHLVRCSFMVDWDYGVGDLQSYDSSDGSFDPFENFVNLTHLLISDCRFPSKVRILDIRAPHLTNLTISSMEHVRNICPDCKIIVASPTLTTFNFVDSHVLQLFLVGSCSIERAHLDVAVTGYQVPKHDFISRLIDMFWAIGDAKDVTLSFQTISILSQFPAELRHPCPFTGMQILRVKVLNESCSTTMSIPVEVLNFLLQGSPTKTFKVEAIKQMARSSIGGN